MRNGLKMVRSGGKKKGQFLKIPFKRAKKTAILRNNLKGKMYPW
jgi:hypothetical protein